MCYREIVPRENYLFLFSFSLSGRKSRVAWTFQRQETIREKHAKCWLATSSGKKAGRVTGQDGWHRGIKTCRMDVGDLSGPAGLVGSGSISVATGVGIIGNATSATPGWWTPTSTITSAAANTDVVSLLSFSLDRSLPQKFIFSYQKTKWRCIYRQFIFDI